MGIFSKVQKYTGFLMKRENGGSFSNPIPIAVMHETTANIGDRIISFWNDDRDIEKFESEGDIYMAQPSEHINSYAVKSGFVAPRAVVLVGMVVAILVKQIVILFGTSSVMRAHNATFVGVHNFQFEKVAKQIRTYATSVVKLAYLEVSKSQYSLSMDSRISQDFHTNSLL